jgi:protein ImuB
MLADIAEALAGHGLTARPAMADTRGAAWALAHFGAGPFAIARRGQTRAAIAALPVAALRLDPEAAQGLAALGLATIGDAALIPRGALARRFGLATLKRLDQALGAEPEPVAPDRPPPGFATRLTLPEPIGHVTGVMAGLERLLERLCQTLEVHQMGARSLRLTARRVDGADVYALIALARPGRDPARIRALFEPGVAGMEAGFGIDALRLEATAVEPLKPAQLDGATGRPRDRSGETGKLADLLSRIGNRIGFENVIRLLPAESHIPERAFTLAAAAWSRPEPFPAGGSGRPLTLFPPERLEAGAASPAGTSPADTPDRHPLPPCRFRWRRRWLTLAGAAGPERLAPEWWWDDPAWRSGLRDYWRVETTEGSRLWLFHTPQAAQPGWWAHGAFA